MRANQRRSRLPCARDPHTTAAGTSRDRYAKSSIYSSLRSEGSVRVGQALCSPEGGWLGGTDLLQAAITYRRLLVECVILSVARPYRTWLRILSRAECTSYHVGKGGLSHVWMTTAGTEALRFFLPRIYPGVRTSECSPQTQATPSLVVAWKSDLFG